MSGRRTSPSARQNNTPSNTPEAIAATATGTSRAVTASTPAATPSASGRRPAVHQAMAAVSRIANTPSRPIVGRWTTTTPGEETSATLRR